MFNEKQKEKLKENWGEKATSMACLAEVRLYDPLSSWQCYVYAMNKEDENEVMTLVRVNKRSLPIEIMWKVNELELLYNSDGEGIQVDAEYRPRRVAEIFKTLSEGV